MRRSIINGYKRKNYVQILQIRHKKAKTGYYPYLDTWEPTLGFLDTSITFMSLATLIWLTRDLGTVDWRGLGSNLLYCDLCKCRWAGAEISTYSKLHKNGFIAKKGIFTCFSSSFTFCLGVCDRIPSLIFFPDLLQSTLLWALDLNHDWKYVY